MSRSPERSELIARLTLLAVPGVSAAHVLRLLQSYGSALEACRHLAPATTAEIAAAARSDMVRERVRRALSAIDDDHIHVIAHGDPLYPAHLADRLGTHAPPILFARGQLELLRVTHIAIVGCRKASEYGLDMAEEIAAGVVRAGAGVVSGLARGIDAAAHSAALEADGATIGVLGCGIDVYYPREQTHLQDRVAREGLLLSELLPGEPPRKHNFPHRNRIIAALSQAVVVVEAGERSGAVATGNHAATQGLPLYCVPNALHHPNMQGIAALLRDGASVYTGLQDFLEATQLIALGDAVPRARHDEAPPADGLHARIWHALGPEPQHADALARIAGIGSTDTLVALLELELDGRVRQLAGQRFERRHRRAVAHG